MRVFIKFFIRGLIFITPIGVTILLIMSAAGWINKKIEQTDLHGLALVLLVVGAVAGIVFVGFVGSSFIVKPISKFFESIIKRIPLVSFIYTSLKDVVGALMGDKKKFDKPVLVRLYGERLYKPGFLTQEDLQGLGLPGKVAVYLPHSYAVAGNIYIVAKEDVQPIDIPSAEMMKLIVSGGVAWSPEGQKEEGLAE